MRSEQIVKQTPDSLPNKDIVIKLKNGKNPWDHEKAKSAKKKKKSQQWDISLSPWLNDHYFTTRMKAFLCTTQFTKYVLYNRSLNREIPMERFLSQTFDLWPALALDLFIWTNDYRGIPEDNWIHQPSQPAS